MSPNEKPTTVIKIDEDEFDFDNLTEEIERTLAEVDAPPQKPPTPNPGLVQRRWPGWIPRL